MRLAAWDFPQMKAKTPMARSNTVRPMIFVTARILWGSSSAGSTEKAMVISVVVKPRTPTILATGLPPGIRMMSGPGGSRCKRINDANTNKYGMKYEIIPMLTSTSYAP